MQRFVNYGVLSVKLDFNEEYIYELLSKDMHLEDSPKQQVKLDIKIRTDSKKVDDINSYFKLEVKGAGRKGISFYSLNNDVISVVIDLPQVCSSISKMFSSSYVDKRSMVLSDFFHGTYIGLLIALLLKQNSILLHASCVNFNSKSHVFISGPQSGKSLLVKELAKLKTGSVVSDDFLVLTSANEIIPLQISLRIPLSKEALRSKRAGIFEYLNFLMFSAFKAFKISSSYRRIPFREVFMDVDDTAKTEKTFYLLRRDRNSDYDDPPVKIIDIMLNEMVNLAGFSPIKSYLDRNNFFDSTFNECFFDVYMRVLESIDIQDLPIPFFSNETNVARFFINKNIISHPRGPISNEFNL